ncbi:hypothetical protein IFM89_019738 [Coptis chinensis]|uniref:Cytochrome P450 n=1 Tax=Coptis chinensis TaxID=261450 RepID=A0A835H4B8_9MAGN|nr:hypothetical protein IFM89_019738 [Coptis chinensis]
MGEPLWPEDMSRGVLPHRASVAFGPKASQAGGGRTEHQGVGIAGRGWRVERQGDETNKRRFLRSKDVEVEKPFHLPIQDKGYTIPAGWVVMVCPPAIHLNLAKYEDPLVFNPWRWKGMEVNGGASKHFMAFGGGLRFCVGTDFTKVQMAVFLHCLLTEYRWIAVKGGDIVRTLGLSFPNGFHVQILKKNI